jgi:hypothetical protein
LGAGFRRRRHARAGAFRPSTAVYLILVHDLTLVTRIVKDVARTGIDVLDPFEHSGPGP